MFFRVLLKTLTIGTYKTIITPSDWYGCEMQGLTRVKEWKTTNCACVETRAPKVFGCKEVVINLDYVIWGTSCFVRWWAVTTKAMKACDRLDMVPWWITRKHALRVRRTYPGLLPFTCFKLRTIHADVNWRVLTCNNLCYTTFVCIADYLDQLSLTSTAKWQMQVSSALTVSKQAFYIRGFCMILSFNRHYFLKQN